MKLSYSKRIFILSVIFFVGTLTLNIIYFNLLVKCVANINNKVKQINLSTQERENQINSADLVNSTELDRSKLQKYFVGSGSALVVDFTKSLEVLAQTMGVTQKKTLAEESIPELGASDVVSAVRYKFSVSGKWSSVYNYILAIEYLPRVVLINNISLSLTEPLTTDGVITGSKFWTADLDFSVAKMK